MHFIPVFPPRTQISVGEEATVAPADWSNMGGLSDVPCTMDEDTGVVSETWARLHPGSPIRKSPPALPSGSAAFVFYTRIKNHLSSVAFVCCMHVCQTKGSPHNTHLMQKQNSHEKCWVTAQSKGGTSLGHDNEETRVYEDQSEREWGWARVYEEQSERKWGWARANSHQSISALNSHVHTILLKPHQHLLFHQFCRQAVTKLTCVSAGVVLSLNNT